MILGNAGIITVIITATSSLVTSRGYGILINAVFLIIGIYIVYKIATRKGLMRKWESFIENKLIKSSAFEEEAAEDLLRFLEGHGVIRVIVKEDSSLVGGSLADHKLTEKKLLVLGIERGKEWIPTPKGKEVVKVGDKLVLYGSLNVLKKLFG
jgi:K+/H+ antiporter YhaU regulatory subunit KhtT